MRTSDDNWSGGAELRAHSRTPTKRKAYLVDGRSAWKCALIDVADGGARIALRDMALPAEGAFLVDSGARRIHLTRVVWRSEREAGLQFIESDILQGPAGGVEGAITIATRFAHSLSQR